MECEVESDLDLVLSEPSDLIILSAAHSVYKKEIVNLLINSPSSFLFDTVGLLDEGQIEVLRERHQISVLGRGDI